MRVDISGVERFIDGVYRKYNSNYGTFAWLFALIRQVAGLRVMMRVRGWGGGGLL